MPQEKMSKKRKQKATKTHWDCLTWGVGVRFFLEGGKKGGGKSYDDGVYFEHD